MFSSRSVSFFKHFSWLISLTYSGSGSNLTLYPCRLISFQECEVVGGLGLFTKCLSVCMYVYRATIRNQHKTGQIYMLEKGFENLYTCSICCFYKTYELWKPFYAFTWYPWLLFSITCFGRHVIPRLSGGEDKLVLTSPRQLGSPLLRFTKGHPCMRC